MSLWVSAIILKEPNPKKRAHTISKFLRIAKECLNYNNFHAVFEINSGLNQSSVHRLKKTWECLKKEDLTLFQEIQELTSNRGSFSYYREKLHKSNPPCIPYLGVYQTDLTFIQDGNPDFTSDSLINFYKRQLVSEVIREIQTYQQEPYNFSRVTAVCDLLEGVQDEILEENHLYSLSLAIEPREEDVAKGKAKSDKSTIGNRSTLDMTAQKTKVNKFFGEEVADIAFVHKISPESSNPKSILDDISIENDTKPFQEVTSVIELSPQQIEEYKKQRLIEYETSLKEKGNEKMEEVVDPYQYDDNAGWI